MGTDPRHEAVKREICKALGHNVEIGGWCHEADPLAEKVLRVADVHDPLRRPAIVESAGPDDIDRMNATGI